MATNIRFHYLYRDSGNYKTFGFQDFSNPNNADQQLNRALNSFHSLRLFNCLSALTIVNFNFRSRLSLKNNWYNLSLEQVQTKITEKLISKEFFYPEESGIEKFDFHRYCDDYLWYEFEFIENVPGTKPEKSIEEFIAGIGTKPR